MLEFVQKAEKLTPFRRPEGMDPLLHTLLTARGIDSPEAAERFLRPNAAHLHDPYALHSMRDAVSIIREAIEAEKRICVYGDYDVDGLCASAILAEHLTELGAEVEIYIPDRHKEGYGLNEDAVRAIAGRCQLLITVDCGISCQKEIALAVSLGLAAVVTDHHRPGAELPECAIVHPQLGAYPCPFLCGAGVAFKVVQALSGLDAALRYVDLAAMATVADIVPLRDENRVIVTLGLAAINTSPRPGVRALIESACLREGIKITASSISFQLAPRINAGGRLASAMLPSRLLRAKTMSEARPLAEELEALNTKRRTLQEDILRQAKEHLADFDFAKHRVIVIAQEGWDLGVIGLSAGRLAEEYHYPTIVLTDHGDLMTGSCRSIPGVDIYQALTSCKELMDHYGGHAQAAGLTLPKENIPLLQEALDNWVRGNVPDTAYIPRVEYDLDVSFDRLSVETINAVSQLEPTGCENPSPLFRARPYVYRSRAVGSGGRHLQLSLSSGGTVLSGIYFGQGALESRLPEQIDILYEPSLNAFGGTVSVQAMVRSLRYPDNEARLKEMQVREESFQRDFLTDLFYNHRNFSSEEVSEMTIVELREALRRDPRGTLILAADMDCAIALLHELSELEIDICVGADPVDPRSFNTMIVYPVGPLPRGFERIVCAAMPNAYGEHARSLTGIPKPVWTEQLPEVEQLRELFIQLQRLTQEKTSCTLRRIAGMLSSQTGLSQAAVLAGVHTLTDVGLFRQDEKGHLTRTDLKRADPLESSFYRCLMEWKHEAMPL